MCSLRLLLAIALLVSGNAKSIVDDVVAGEEPAEQDCQDLSSAIQLPSAILKQPQQLAALELVANPTTNTAAETMAVAEEDHGTNAGTMELMAQRAREFSQRVSSPVTSFFSSILGMSEAELEENIKDTQNKVHEYFLGIALAPAIIVFFTALLYRNSCKGNRVAAPSELCEDFKDWNSGPFDCHHAPATCFWACLCPCIRGADTLSLVDLVGFWMGVVFSFFGLAMLDIFVSGLLGWICSAMILTYFRRQLRVKFEFADPGSLVGDFCLYFWCFTCSMAQEARHVDAATRRGHPAVGECVSVKA